MEGGRKVGREGRRKREKRNEWDLIHVLKLIDRHFSFHPSLTPSYRRRLHLLEKDVLLPGLGFLRVAFPLQIVQEEGEDKGGGAGDVAAARIRVGNLEEGREGVREGARRVKQRKRELGAEDAGWREMGRGCTG